MSTLEQPRTTETTTIQVGSIAGRPRVLIGVPGKIGERMSGPGIRAWALARALSESFDVTVAVTDPPASSRDGIRLVPFARRHLLREVMTHDAVISACVPPYLLPMAAASSTVVVSDQYDPVDLEVATLPDSLGTRRAVASQLAVNQLHLRYADVVLCANARQRERIQARLAALGPKALGPKDHGPELIELPFGLGEPPPPPSRRPLRERFPQISDDDTVVLWWGVVWRWLDADTAVRAVAGLAQKRPDIKLVFAPARTLGADTEATNATERARHLARDLGVLDRTVLFWEDWVPFDQRHELLAEAHIGLSLHGVSQEAHFSARVRYLDYLWASLPCILADGDETGTRFADAGFSTLVTPGDDAMVREALVRLADDRDALARARDAGTALAREYRWETLAKPLARTLERRALERRALKAEASLPVERTLRVSRYYARRLVDKAVYALEHASAAADNRVAGA
jgi:glycosyltransferase involved in cell wall biosynthesis